MTRMTLEWVTTDISEQWRMQDLGGVFPQGIPTHSARGYGGAL